MIDFEIIKKAIYLTQTGKFDDAKMIYEGLLKDYPDDVNLLSMFGLFYVNTGDYNNAAIFLHRAYGLNKTLGTVSALGLAEFEKGNYSEASKYLEESLEFGKSVDIYNKLILSLFEIKNYQKAVDFANKMFELYPDDSRSIANKVKALTQTGNLLEAEKLCIEGLQKNPEISHLWFHLGFLKELIYCDDKIAKKCYKAASDLGNPNADYNIAVSCQKLGEFDEAEKYYKQMLQNNPDNIETMTSLGMCYLTQKRFKEGYDLFFKREISKKFSHIKNFWKVGDKIADEIQIVCDQGFGDQIQFVRYLSFLSDKKISFFTPKSLKELFEKNYPNVDFINYEELDLDKQTFRITDLAYALNMDFDNIPFSGGYLKSETSNIKSEKKKVGLCWEAGSAGIRTMINRTINVSCFEPLFNLENIQIYSFQYTDSLGGNEKYPQIIKLAKDFNSFMDTAKALKAMDIVITVDTSVAHLAGALGVKTYLLIPYASDWRWFDDNKKTPWYNSVEIFKQTDNISWENQINSIVELLNSYD